MDRTNGRGNRTHATASATDSGDDEPFLDQFTDVDEQLEAVVDQLEAVGRTNTALAEAVAALTDAEIDLPSRVDRPLVADAVIEPALADGVTEPDDYDGNTETVTLEIPRSGYISEVVLVFPAGASQSVGVGIEGVNDESLVPFGPSDVNYIALDDQSIDFSLDYDVAEGEEIEVNFINAREAQTTDAIADLTAYASSVITVSEEV